MSPAGKAPQASLLARMGAIRAQVAPAGRPKVPLYMVRGGETLRGGYVQTYSSMAIG